MRIISNLRFETYYNSISFSALPGVAHWDLCKIPPRFESLEECDDIFWHTRCTSYTLTAQLSSFSLWHFPMPQVNWKNDI
jgi:hypothetical protein